LGKPPGDEREAPEFNKTESVIEQGVVNKTKIRPQSTGG